jgi:site-specific recombinase XerD
MKKIYDALNSSFKFAQNKGMIVHNPMALITSPSSIKTNQAKKDIEIFSDDEIKRFVEAVSAKHSNGTPIYRNGSIFLLMLNTGLRIGEACALKWTDYNEEAKTLSIRSSMIQTRDSEGKRVVAEQDSVKTKYSNRILKLNSNAINALPNKRIGKYIFCTYDGKLLEHRDVQRTLDNILNRAGIPHKSTHVFRHTFASRLFAKGYDVRVVSELLGHTDVNTTYNTYIQLIKQQKAQAMEAIEDMY